MTLPVYLLPGPPDPPGATADFAFLAPMLARRRPTTVLDLPAAAESADPDRLAERADRVLATLPRTPFALVGHALGAAVAVAVAARSPLVERLVLIAPGPETLPDLTRFTAPTLLVTARDVAARDDAARRPAALPAHAHRVLLDSGAMLLERPAEVLRYLDGFLDGVVLGPVTP